jgi:hypothetical protein
MVDEFLYRNGLDIAATTVDLVELVLEMEADRWRWTKSSRGCANTSDHGQYDPSCNASLSLIPLGPMWSPPRSDVALESLLRYEERMFERTNRQATPERLGAFSDGVIAIIITIMVLDLKAPSRVGLPAVFTLGRPFLVTL